MTFNLDDFRADHLALYNVEAKHPDDFVIETIDLSPGAVAKVIAEQAGALKNPPRPILELLDTLRDQGLLRYVAELRELFGTGDPKAPSGSPGAAGFRPTLARRRFLGVAPKRRR